MTRIALVVLVALGALSIPSTEARPGPPLVCHELQIGTARSLPWKEGPFGMDPAFDREKVPGETVRILAESDDAVVHMETLRRAYLYLGIGSDHVSLASLGGALKDRILEVSTMEVARASREPRPQALAWFDLGYLMAIIENNGRGAAGSSLVSDKRSPRFLDHAAAMAPESPDVQVGVGWGLAGNGIARGERLIEHALQLATPDSLVVKNFGKAKSPATRPAPESLPRRPEQPGETGRPEDTRDGLSFITIDEAKKQFDLGVPFFDARPDQDFAEGHVKGAVLFDPTDDSVIGATAKPEWLKKFDPRSPAIVYCNGGDCDSSKIVAAQLAKFGFTNVKSFEPGFWGWRARGYPTIPQPLQPEPEALPRPLGPRRRMVFIKIEEAKTHFDLGVQCFDARVKADFKAGHVKGAVNVDPTDEGNVATRTVPQFLDRFDRAKTVIVYDDGGDCDAAQLIAIQMRKFGFTDVKVFEEGFPTWKAKGYPVEPTR